MNTLLIHQVFNTPDTPGGTRHFELARDAAERGHRFTVISSDTLYHSDQRVVDRVRLATKVELPELTLIRTYTYPSTNRSFAWRVVSFLSFMVSSFVVAVKQRNIDIVMGTTPQIFQAVSAWLVAAIRRKPFLLEVRDLWPEFAIDIGVLTNPLLIRASRMLESFLYARASHILVNSPAYRDYLIAKGIAPERISVIANGVVPEMFDPAVRGEEFRAQWAQSGDFVATYAGAIGMANDLPTLLQAADRLKDRQDIRIWIVGDGKDRPALEAQAKEMGLQNVQFTGSVKKDKMADVLAASDACIAILKNIPMFRTTYPNKVFDYMAAGRPTILAIDGVIRNVIEAGEGGIFVPPGDPDALAAAIRALADNPAAAAQMGESARQYVVAHFSRHDQALAFAELLERVGKM